MRAMLIYVLQRLLAWLQPVEDAPCPRGLRSPQWSRVRNAHLQQHPACEACGGTDDLNVHHKQPFHLWPELELEPKNLITLCETGPAHCNCHLLFGHCGNWSMYNPTVEVDVVHFRTMLALRKQS